MSTRLVGLLFWVIAAAPACADMGFAMVMPTSTGSAVGGGVTFLEVKEGLRVSVWLEGLTPGTTHAFHIHEFGTCDDSGKSAGGHYNPLESPHGFLPKDGIKHAHGGDMGNIVAENDGSVGLNIILPEITVTGGKYNIAGRAVVVHEKADDFGQPVGNAGARIACGPIVITHPGSPPRKRP